MTEKDNGIGLAQILAQGWNAMFAVYIANLVLDLIRCNVMNSCGAWSAHIGPGGLVVISIVMFIYVLVPIAVRTYSAHWFRYTVIGITAFMTLFYIAHELTHLLAGDKPFGIAHILDLTHHVIGVSMIVVAAKWARLSKEKSYSHGSEKLQVSGQA